jgi:hypothetical protein
MVFLPSRLSLLLGFAFISTAWPALAEKEKHIVQVLNAQLGKTEQQMTADWGATTGGEGPGQRVGQYFEQLQDGRKRLTVISEPVFRSSPGQPRYTRTNTPGCDARVATGQTAEKSKRSW